MTNKKALYTAINILLYAVGFPVLFIISLVSSIEWNSYGMYGASAFAPLIAVIILWVLVGGIQALIYNIGRKKGGKAAKNLAIKLAVVPIAVIVGILGILDIAMPPLLDDATSSTIFYEDVVDDWQGMHEKLYDRTQAYLDKNGYEKGTKFQSDEVQAQFDRIFQSMDKAYASFDPLAIEVALDQDDLLASILNGKFPIRLAATLMLITSNDPNLTYDHNINDLDRLLMLSATKLLKIYSMVNDGEIDLNNGGLNKILNTVLVSYKIDGMEWNIFNILGSNILDASVDPNAAIYDVGYSVLDEPTLVGACLGYQDMAWLNGMTMMFFIPLMSIRSILYVFAALLAFFTLLQFYVAEAYSKKSGEKFSLYMIGKSVKVDDASSDLNGEDADKSSEDEEIAQSGDESVENKSLEVEATTN